jgi:hypothetical protein
VLSDAALRRVVDNLAALKLDPVLHLKIAVAVVGPLMSDDEKSVHRIAPIFDADRGGPHTNAAARKRKSGLRPPIAITYKGETFPSRGAMAKHLALTLKRSAVTLTHTLRELGDDAEAVVRRYQPETPAATPAKAYSHDERAARYLREKLERGPVPADQVDAEVESGRLRTASVEKAKAELGLVARRVNHGRGSVVHLCLPDQAAELEA